MRKLLTTLGLCFVVHAAAAQCALDAPAPHANAGTRGDFIRATTTGGDAALRNAASEHVIRTATDPRGSAARAQVSAARSGSEVTGGDGTRRSGTGTAMLLAALAVMAAIAWRHVASPDR